MRKLNAFIELAEILITVIMKNNVYLTYLLISLFGILSIVLPVYLQPDINQYDSPVFPMIRTGIEEFSGWSFCLLFLSGFGAKLLTNLSEWKIGLLTMVLFPVLAICEMIVDPSSHNLLPFEFIIYGFFTIPAMIGAYLAVLGQKIYKHF
jgi:hypothetical protein